MQNLGVFWIIQDICYIMGTDIFKIEEEMPEKMKLEVATRPSKNWYNNIANLLNFPKHPQILHFG